MDSHLIEALIRSLEHDPALSTIDLIRRAKIIVRTVSDKRTTERVVITKILMIICQNRDKVNEVVDPEIIYGLKTLIDGGLVGQVADEIKIRPAWCDCCL
jgi:hypothetical protein